jgi:Fic family protein
VAERPLPLEDNAGRPFHFTLTDSIQRQLSDIDRNAAGSIAVPDPILNNEIKTQFLIDSLIEEAITSSQLEGAATTREVAAELLRSGRPPVDHSEQMIFNNYRAIQHIRELGPLTPAAVVELHRIVTEATLENPADAGRIQQPGDRRVVVTDNRSAAVLHTPPPAEQLPARLDAMCAFANDDTGAVYLHPVLRAIVLHFWLSYDHPFVDGNGRTARSLYYYAVAKRGYWLLEYVAISPYLRAQPAAYGDAFLFTESDGNDLTYFIEYHLDVITRGITQLKLDVTERARVVREIEQRLRSTGALNHRQLALLSHALRHPQRRYTIQSHAGSHRIAYATARADLHDLVKLGLLEQRQGPGKQQVFLSSEQLRRQLSGIDGSNASRQQPPVEPA